MTLMIQVLLAVSLVTMPSWELLFGWNSVAMLTLALYSFVKKWNNLFLSLLALEFMTLAFFLSLASLALATTVNFELFFIFFTLAVCEASLGVAVLILFSHATGSESLYSLLPV